MALLRRAWRLCTVSVALAASVAGCRDRPVEPIIGFAYNWSEPGLAEFLDSAVAREAPADAAPIRVVSEPIAKWRSRVSTMLAAEVNRAIELAGDPRVVVVVGPAGSREALQVAPVYRRAGLAHIVPTATSRLLGSAGRWTFLMAPNDSLQGEFIGAFADTVLGAHTAAIFYAPDEYGMGLAAGTAASLAARGVSLIDRVPVRPGQDCLVPAAAGEYRRLVAELATRGTPDVVVVATRSLESACLLGALRQRWPRVRFVAGDGAYVNRNFMSRAGSATNESYYVAFWHPSLGGAASQSFALRFERATGRAPRHDDAMAYDAVLIAARAIHAVGADRRSVRAYLATIGAGREPYGGITGPVAFPPSVRRALLMTRLHDGVIETVGAR